MGVQRRVEVEDVGLVQSVLLERIGQYPVKLRVVSRECAERWLRWKWYSIRSIRWRKRRSK